MPYRYKIYRDKRILLFQGDVRNRDVFDKEFIDLIIISSPYNVGIEYNSNDDELTYDGYLDFTRLWVKNYYDWNKSQARFLLDILLHKKKEGQKRRTKKCRGRYYKNCSRSRLEISFNNYLE